MSTVTTSNLTTLNSTTSPIPNPSSYFSNVSNNNNNNLSISNLLNQSSTSTLDPFPTEKLALAIVLSLMNSTAIIFYLIVWSTVIRNYKEFKNSFYLFIISTGVPDLTFMSIGLFYCVPCLIQGRGIYGFEGDLVIGYLQMYVSLTQAAHILYISVNRWSYVAPTTYKLFSRFPSSYTQRQNIRAIIFLYASSFLLLLANILTKCRWIYSISSLDWEETTRDKYSMAAGRIDQLVISSFPVLATLLYLFTWTSIVIKRKQTVGDSSMIAQTSKRELRLLLQFTLVTSVVMVYMLSMWLAPLAKTPHQKVVAALMLNVLGNFNAAANPPIYVMFDQKIRTFFLNDCTSAWKRVKRVLHLGREQSISDSIFVEGGGGGLVVGGNGGIGDGGASGTAPGSGNPQQQQQQRAQLGKNSARNREMHHGSTLKVKARD